MDTTLLTALIAGGVALIGTLLSLYVNNKQTNAKFRELELKERELSNASEKLAADARALTQMLQKEVFSKRIDAYEALWRICITHEKDWTANGNKHDIDWVNEYLSALRDWNANHGAFLSQMVYAPFVQYREKLEEIRKSMLAWDRSPDELIYDLFILSHHSDKTGHPGLYAAIKNDLGAYQTFALRVYA
jgi:hypothetical protein